MALEEYPMPVLAARIMLRRMLLDQVSNKQSIVVNLSDAKRIQNFVLDEMRKTRKKVN